MQYELNPELEVVEPCLTIFHVKEIYHAHCISCNKNAREKSGIKQSTNSILEQFKKSNKPISFDLKAVRQIVLEGPSNLKKRRNQRIERKVSLLKIKFSSVIEKAFYWLECSVL